MIQIGEEEHAIAQRLAPILSLLLFLFILRVIGQLLVVLNLVDFLPLMEGWLYLAVIIDLYSRKVVGWAMSNRLRASLVIKALLMAYWRRKPEKGLIHHSDRGSQYASDEYQKFLRQFGMLCSMSRKGDCWDNAVVESFFGRLKTEWISDSLYRTRDEARLDVINYIEMFYNSHRLHSFLGYEIPKEFENNIVETMVA